MTKPWVETHSTTNDVQPCPHCLSPDTEAVSYGGWSVDDDEVCFETRCKTCGELWMHCIDVEPPA